MKYWFLKYQKYIIGIGFILLIAFGIYRNSSKEYELNKYGKVTVAKIIGFKYIHVTSYKIKYEYFVEGVNIVQEERTSYFECDSGEDGCLGKKFQVVYSTKDPKISVINLGKYNIYKKNSPSVDFRQFE